MGDWLGDWWVTGGATGGATKLQSFPDSVHNKCHT